ncbi:MAG: TolC family protein [Vulcanimicrobiaceae bacterium]
MSPRSLLMATCAAAAIALAVGALPARAQTPVPMTLQDAISYALDHNTNIEQQVVALTAAEHNLAILQNSTFPNLSAELQNEAAQSRNYSGAYSIIGATQQNTFSQNTAQIGTNATVNLAGNGLIQMAADRALVAQSKYSLAYSESQVATSVTNSFYSVIQKRAIVQVDQSSLGYQNALVAAAKAKLHAGTAAGVDVMRAQISWYQTASNLTGAKADEENARENLAQTIGAPLSTQFVYPSIDLQPPLPNGSSESLQTVASNSRPDVLSARESLVAARQTRKTWDRELAPSAVINGSFGNQFSPTVFAQEQASSPVPLPRGSPGFWQVSVTSTFTLPLVDYGQRHFERLNDDANIANAEVSLSQTTNQAQLDVSQSYRAAETALTQLDLARQEAALGLQSARIAQLQYKIGVIALADVFQAQQTSVQAQSDLINARVNYVEAVVKLRVSIGTYDAHTAVADLR